MNFQIFTKVCVLRNPGRAVESRRAPTGNIKKLIYCEHRAHSDVPDGLKVLPSANAEFARGLPRPQGLQRYCKAMLERIFGLPLLDFRLTCTKHMGGQIR